MYVYPVHVYAKFKWVKLGKKFLFRTSELATQLWNWGTEKLMGHVSIYKLYVSLYITGHLLLAWTSQISWFESHWQYIDVYSAMFVVTWPSSFLSGVTSHVVYILDITHTHTLQCQNLCNLEILLCNLKFYCFPSHPSKWSTYQMKRQWLIKAIDLVVAMSKPLSLL